MPYDDEGDHEVGYGKPPRHSQFIKGQSGNPRGRPTGAKNLKTLLNKALNELVIVTENGGRRKISKREAIITQLVNGSAKGDFKAIQILLAMLRDIEGHAEAGAADPDRFTEADAQIIQRIRARLRGATE
jgi:hypothetical protein